MQTKPTNRDLAEHWKCSIRTIQRARLLGVNVHSPLSMAKYVIGLQNPALHMLAVAQAELAKRL